MIISKKKNIYLKKTKKKNKQKTISGGGNLSKLSNPGALSNQRSLSRQTTLRRSLSADTGPITGRRSTLQLSERPTFVRNPTLYRNPALNPSRNLQLTPPTRMAPKLSPNNIKKRLANIAQQKQNSGYITVGPSNPKFQINISPQKNGQVVLTEAEKQYIHKNPQGKLAQAYNFLEARRIASINEPHNKNLYTWRDLNKIITYLNFPNKEVITNPNEKYKQRMNNVRKTYNKLNYILKK